MTTFLAMLVALVMIAGGAAHFAATQSFEPLVPPVFPARPVILATGVLQIAIGIAALAPRTRALAGLAFALLCLAYLPLHLWDFVRPDPVFAPPIAAGIRVAVQIAFIVVGYALWKRASSSSTASA